MPDAKRAKRANREAVGSETAAIGTIGTIGNWHGHLRRAPDAAAAEWRRCYHRHLAWTTAKTDYETQEHEYVAAFDRTISDWHRQHGARPPEGVCAGCGGPLNGHEAYSLHDGARLHDDDCLRAYGATWRAAAADALARMGVGRPESWEP